MKPKVNSISIETESENVIFLFIPCTPCALEGFNRSHRPETRLNPFLKNCFEFTITDCYRNIIPLRFQYLYMIDLYNYL